MDNKVGQDDKQKNVAEEEVAPSRNVRGSALVKNQVEGEKKDSTAGNTNSSMAATTSTQNVVLGDTNQSSTTEPYKSKTMSFKPENSDPQSHTHYSNTEVDQKNISSEIEDVVLTPRLAEMEGSSSLVGPGQPSSSKINTTPKKIIRIDRDYTSGELCQFQTAFPLEIDGRVNPRRFQQTINKLNEMLLKAHSPKYNMLDNCFACLTIYTSTLCLRSHFDRTMEEVCEFLDNENINLYNPQGLNFRDPQRNSFLFIELELY